MFTTGPRHFTQQTSRRLTQRVRTEEDKQPKQFQL